MMELGSGFIVGILGSLHCVGMCGPLVLALPLTRTERAVIAYQSLIYNLGRIWVYGIMGFLIGVIGWGIQLGGMQKALSIVLGSIMILTSLGALSSNSRLAILKNKIAASSSRFLKKLLTISTGFSALRVGMINGLLPCGLVYVALAFAVTLGSPLNSAGYMIFFGLGTLPMMLAVMIGGKMYRGLALKLKPYLPILTALLGAYLIMRGIKMQLVENPNDILTGLTQMGCH